MDEKQLRRRKGTPQQRAIELNRQLKKADTQQEVMAIVAKHHNSFDHINVSTALNLLGRSSHVSNHRHRAEAVAAAVRRLEAHIVEHAADYGPQGIANSACGLAKLGLKSHAAFEALQGQALRKMTLFKPQELTMCASPPVPSSLVSCIPALLPSSLLPSTFSPSLLRSVTLSRLFPPPSSPALLPPSPPPSSLPFSPFLSHHPSLDFTLPPPPCILPPSPLLPD